MGEVKWIKITISMFDDEKIDYIESLPESDSIIVIWIKLLTLAGKCNAGGYIFLTESIPYTDDMLSHKFKRPLNTVKLALATFEKLKMIEFINDFLVISNWEKHQNIDALQQIKEQNRLRNRKYRQKLLTCDVTVTSRDALDQELDLDIDKDIDRNRIPPPVGWVKKYCDERKNGIDAQDFVDWYTARGWMVGKAKMKDWQASIRTWENKRKEKQKDVTKSTIDAMRFNPEASI